MIEEAVLKSLKKNPMTFLALYEANVDCIYAYILSRVGREEDAQKLLEQTFLTALERINTVHSGKYSFARWLLQIASLSVAQWEKGKRISYSEEAAGPQQLKLDGLGEKEREILRLLLIARFSPEEVSKFLKCEIEEVHELFAHTLQKIEEGQPSVSDPLKELSERFSSLTFPLCPRAELKGRLEERIRMMKRRSSLIYRLRVVLLPLFSVGFLLLIFFGIRYLFPVEPALPALDEVTLRQPTSEEMLSLPGSYTATAIPPEVMVYRTNAGAELNDVERLCDLLGVFRSIRLTADTFVAGFYDELIVWRNSGSFLYQPCPLSEEGNILVGADALTKARTFLQEKNLWPADVSGSSLVTGPVEGLVTVQFHRALNGLPVEGARIEVAFNGDELVRLYYNWRAVLPFRHYPVQEVERAKETVLLKKELSDFLIENVQLTLVEAGPDEHQEFLLPAFIFSGTRRTSGTPCQYKSWALDPQYLSP